MKPERVLAVAVGGVVLVAVAAAVVVALRPEPDFDPSTPEGTVQSYLRAVFDDDLEAAAAYLDGDGDCGAEDLEQAEPGDPARVVLVDVEAEGDSATVALDVIRDGGGGPFDSYEYTDSQSFELERSGDGWVIAGVPWPLYFCEGND